VTPSSLMREVESVLMGRVSIRDARFSIGGGRTRAGGITRGGRESYGIFDF
jgi:hypothetical protein